MDVIESYLRANFENKISRATREVIIDGKPVTKEVIVIKGPLVPKKNVCPPVEESCKALPDTVKNLERYDAIKSGNFNEDELWTIEFAEIFLGRTELLTKQEKEALLFAHYTELAKGGFNRINPKIDILSCVFDKAERETLIRSGIAGVVPRSAINRAYDGVTAFKSAQALGIENAEAKRVMGIIFEEQKGFTPNAQQLREYMRPLHDSGEMATMISDFWVDETLLSNRRIYNALGEYFESANPGKSKGKKQVQQWISSLSSDEKVAYIIDYIGLNGRP